MTPKTFPYIEIQGSHEKVGNAIGEMFRVQIRRHLAKIKARVPNCQSFINQTSSYLDTVRRFFPEVFNELKGVAQGAGIECQEYMLMNASELLVCDYHEHCTTAVSFGPDGAVIGHNEDWLDDEMENLYILKATIGEVSFLCLDYATYLPGSAASMNSWGLVQCINDLSQKPHAGVPKYVLARAVLSCKTLQEAEALVAKTPRASGFNHVLVQGGEVWNFEIASEDLAVERISGRAFIHTNHVLSQKMKPYETGASASSLARYQRAKELITNDMTVTKMQALLSDTQNSRYPICRPAETLGSVIIVPEKREMYVCCGHPCAGTYKKYTL